MSYLKNCTRIIAVFIWITFPVIFGAANQVILFNDFANNSWKSHIEPLVIGGHAVNATIERHLVREFNTAVWGPLAGGHANQIDPTIANLADVRNYYQTTAVNPADWVTLVTTATPNGLGGWNTALANDGSPRKWMRNLNLREIYRFSELVRATPALLDNASHATDDLVKARSLTGTFWEVDTTGTYFADETFSGMLVPGQPLPNATYQVHTCVHGFTSGNINNTHLSTVPYPVAYYFVPYGVAASGDPAAVNYVTAVGFLVTHVTHFRLDVAGTNIGINTAFFNDGSAEMSTQNLYSNKDYAMVTIEGQTGGAIPLRDILAGTPLGIINVGDANLPNLDNNGVGLGAIGNGILGANERLFVMGLASYPTAALDLNIAVSTSATNETPENEPRRSFRDDQNTKVPLNIGKEALSSLPSFPGISGGPVLRCQLDPTIGNEHNKRCVVVGTIWGAERVFNNDNVLDGFKNFINKVP